MKNWTKIVIGIVLVLVLGGGVWAYETRQNSQSTNQSQEAQSKIINYDGEEGKSAYEILKSQYRVEASESSFGVMVNSINGLASTDKEFWLYSVNGHESDVAADKYTTHAGDKVVWEYKGM